MLKTAQFVWRGATFTIRRLTVGDEMDAEIIAQRLRTALNLPATDVRMFYRRDRFATFVVSLDSVSGEVGLPIPRFDMNDTELADTFTQWMDATGWYGLWDEANLRLAVMPNAPELQPGAEKNGFAPQTENVAGNSD